jgi:hypothetical protein
LRDEPEKIGQLMRKVKNGVVDGVNQVVRGLALEKKYKDVAMEALSDGMHMVEMQFEKYMNENGKEGGAGGSSTEDEFGPGAWWEPRKFETAVCCMAGMECYSSDFANAAGRAQLEDELALYE